MLRDVSLGDLGVESAFWWRGTYYVEVRVPWKISVSGPSVKVKGVSPARLHLCGVCVGQKIVYSVFSSSYSRRAVSVYSGSRANPSRSGMGRAFGIPLISRSRACQTTIFRYNSAETPKPSRRPRRAPLAVTGISSAAGWPLMMSRVACSGPGALGRLRANEGEIRRIRVSVEAELRRRPSRGPWQRIDSVVG